MLGIGTAPDDMVFVWDVATSSKLAGCELALPFPCTAASFDPLDRDRFVTLGAKGIAFWKVRCCVHRVAVRDQLAVRQPSTDPAVALAQISQEYEGYVLTYVAGARTSGTSVTVDSGVDTKPSVADSAITRVQHGASNKWTTHVWDTEHNVYAANQAGELVRFSSATGAVLSVFEPAGGVVLTSLVCCREHIVAGAEDGIVRWLSIKDGVITRRVC